MTEINFYKLINQLAWEKINECGEDKSFKSFGHILEIGGEALKEALQSGRVVRDIIFEPGKPARTGYFIDNEKEVRDELIFHTQPKKLSKNGRGYFSFSGVELNSGEVVSKFKPVVCDTYTFEQVIQSDNALFPLMRQNKIAFKIWDKVLSFDRQPKSIIKDEKGLANFAEESRLMKMSVEEMKDTKVFFGHFYDSRGRLYQDGWTLNYQGDEWSKAALSPFVGTDELSFSGMIALKHHLANQFGLDKLPYIERQKAVNDGKCSDVSVAKKQILATKALEQLERAKVGESFKGSVTIDATNSGFQVYACLTGDAEVARATNLVTDTECNDLYSDVANVVLSKASNGSDFSISDIREAIKKSIMGVAYNSKALPKEKWEELKDKGLKISESDYMTCVNVSKHIANAQNVINKFLVANFSDNKPQDCIVRYTMPDGFKVELDLITKHKMEQLIELGRGKGRERVIWTYNRLGWDYEENWRSLVPNIIHSIDAYVCREVIRRCKFRVVTIHDSFTCHPNNVGELRTVYTQLLKEVKEMNMLEYILKQINPSFTYTPTGDGFEVLVSQDSYALC